jgi:hypothetical protein
MFLLRVLDPELALDRDRLGQIEAETAHAEGGRRGGSDLQKVSSGYR